MERSVSPQDSAPALTIEPDGSMKLHVGPGSYQQGLADLLNFGAALPPVQPLNHDQITKAAFERVGGALRSALERARERFGAPAGNAG